MTIEAVIFDIGNVLIEWQPERFYDVKIGEARRKAMFNAVDLHAINDRVDQGENFKSVIYAAAEDYPEWTAEIRMWHDHWAQMAAPSIPASVEILRELKAAGVPVLALSNFGIQPFELAEKIYPFLTEFDQRFISGHMGCVKPHQPIYEMLEAECGFVPETLFFTDDRQENIDTAAGRGWHTHLFEQSGGLRDRLVAEGLLKAIP